MLVGETGGGNVIHCGMECGPVLIASLTMCLFMQQECCSFEIFHMREPDIPVDTIEIKGEIGIPVQLKLIVCVCV